MRARRLGLAACLLTFGACSSPKYFLSDAELARFNAAGPVTPEFDETQLLASLRESQPYRVVVGDIVEIHAPTAAFEESPTNPITGATIVTRLFRVSTEGRINLPLIGSTQVLGLELSAIEQAISKALYPKYLTSAPSLVATIWKHHRLSVTVLGAVGNPGRHNLRSDQLTLTDALTAAGGIRSSGEYVLGARQVKIYSSGKSVPQKIVLPIRGLYVPYYEVELQGGERIEVERYEPDTFTIVGLVRQPGEKDFPPEESLNLMQAISAAGGIDTTAAPPYATVFRQDARTGEILPATFHIKGNGLVAASSLVIKPGDVIAIEHTAGSWTRAFMSDVFGVRIGFDLRRNELD